MQVSQFMLTRETCLKERWQFRCDGSVISTAATPNCSLIVAATVGRSVYLLNSDGDVIWEKRGNCDSGLDHEAWSTAIAADGSVIAVGTANKNPSDGTLYVYNSKGDQVFSHALKSPVWSIALTPDGTIMAVACWNGNAYKFQRQRSGFKLVSTFKSKVTGGLYGIRLNRDGTRGYVCAYDEAIVILNEKWHEIGRFECKEGLYNICLTETSELAIAGLRAGELLCLEPSALVGRKIKIPNCSRPICGVAMSGRGDLIVCGSFDGWIYVITGGGSLIGRIETSGEVWSVACSEDAALICVASGDHTLRLIDNSCSAAPIREVLQFDSAVCKSGAEIDVCLGRLIRLYSQYGLFEYGYARLREMQEQSSDPIPFRNSCERLLILATSASGSNDWALYELGVLYQEQTRHKDAISYFQKAAKYPGYTARALTRCADSFTAKQLPNATASCYRRAREQQIDSDAKRVLYNLGRSYEDTKQWGEAISHFQLLASWDVAYRNTWERLEYLLSIHASVRKEEMPRRADYTGVTISLLGPDAPRDVDENLKAILQARTAELLIKPGERERVASIIQKLRGNERFSRGITGTGLEYDTELFLKYDFSLPEDETKKFLETVNLFYLLGAKKPSETLDIGSATGRYPMLLTWMGAKARGIDIEERAIRYAEGQMRADSDWPKYQLADARSLPFEIPTFDLVTCMMGTFAHIPASDQNDVIAKIFNALLPSGHVAISTWDMECGHLAYLSIYNEKQKDTIRSNSPSAKELMAMLEKAGFINVQIRSFCMLPQIVIYDLGIANLRAGDIQLIAQADLAVRALYPDRHGEMYLAFGMKPKIS